MRRAVLPVSPRLACWALVLLASGACTGSSQNDETSGPDPGDDDCIATMAFMQKDAYRTMAGRSYQQWPSHTTTQLDVLCGGVRVAGGVRENHGVGPQEVDDNGTMIVERVASLAAEGTRSELSQLAESYRSCECGTTFVSLDAIDDDGVEELLAAVSSYMASNLACAGGYTGAQLGAALQAGDIEFVLGELGNCSWPAGATWGTAFDEALSTTAGANLDDFHVANNDALLQGNLLQTYAASGAVGPCDRQHALCKSPLWFYEP